MLGQSVFRHRLKLKFLNQLLARNTFHQVIESRTIDVSKCQLRRCCLRYFRDIGSELAGCQPACESRASTRRRRVLPLVGQCIVFRLHLHANLATVVVADDAIAIFAARASVNNRATKTALAAFRCGSHFH